jgi:hypothetical protein
VTAVDDLRVEALFCSDLQPSDHDSPDTVRATVHAVVFSRGEACCAEEVAAEFGEHPECALKRMQWARTAAAEAFEFEPA